MLMHEHDEEARLDALYQLKLLDTSPNESFDRITRMAGQIFELPIAAVSLTDRDRQWFKSRLGIMHHSISRHKAPCAEVAETTSSLVIPDLLAHPTYSTSRLADDGIRFYAGAPLVTREGYGLGSLCVLGTEPRAVSPAQIAALSDLAAMVMTQIELQHAFGRVDPLSGLPNRNQFLDDLADLARDHRGERRMAVFVDLARHDQINTITRVMGVARVDDLVREAAQAVRSLLGPDRCAYHVAATQFAFLSPPCDDEQAYMTLLSSGFDSVRAESIARFVTSVALGVMPFTLGAVSPRDVLRGAHSAAQDARQSDGAVGLYSALTDRIHSRRLELIQWFGVALENTDELRLVFQPRIDLKSGRCVSAEALLRWEHPVLGDVSPGEFIPIIEQTSLVKETTNWVMDAAMRHLSQWQAAGLNLSLSINISASNLNESDFVKRLQLCLLKHRVRPECLEIEITESAVMSDTRHGLACLEELAATGIRIAIDDFGTGQSSLSYLQKMSADIVKIDQSFVRTLTEKEDCEHALVSAMIALCHRLGYTVVAEGVETDSAVEVLSRLGCEEAQGYFFARPLEANELTGWISNRHVQLEASWLAA